MSPAGVLHASGEPPEAGREGASAKATGVVPCLPGAHAARATTVDERARRLSHEELAVAQILAAEGHRVRSLPERPGRGPTADLEVCGTPLEVKSFLPLPERAGRAPSARSVCNKLLAARAQATTAVLYARGSGLGEAAARTGVEDFASRNRTGRIAAVRIVGDGFDLAWSPKLMRELGSALQPARDAARGLHPARRPTPRRGPGLDAIGR